MFIKNKIKRIMYVVLITLLASGGFVLIDLFKYGLNIQEGVSVALGVICVLYSISKIIDVIIDNEIPYIPSMYDDDYKEDKNV